MTLDLKRSEILRTYRNVMSFLLGVYATDDATEEAFICIFNFWQSSAMTEETEFEVLMDTGLRCGTVLSDRRFRYLFIDGLVH